MKDKRLVLVEWIDAFGCDSVWTDIEDLVAVPVICKSVGWLTVEADAAIILSPHITQEDHESASFQTCGNMAIPRVAVKTITDLIASS